MTGNKQIASASHCTIIHFSCIGSVTWKIKQKNEDTERKMKYNHQIKRSHGGAIEEHTEKVKRNWVYVIAIAGPIFRDCTALPKDVRKHAENRR
jgi:hypothetical protein